MKRVSKVIIVQARCTMTTPDMVRLEGEGFNVIVPMFRVLQPKVLQQSDELQTFTIDGAYKNAHRLTGGVYMAWDLGNKDRTVVSPSSGKLKDKQEQTKALGEKENEQ